MSTKRWKLVVTDLGGGQALSEVTTEGDNWMQALAAGRERIGESGVVPPGASCVPTSDGGVAVLDPASRRRYVLSRSTGGAAEAPQGGASEAPARAPGPPKKKQRMKTVAYMPSPVAQPEAPPSGGGKGKSPKRTVAYMPSPLAAQAPAGPKEVVVGAKPQATPPKPEPKPEPEAEPRPQPEPPAEAPAAQAAPEARPTGDQGAPQAGPTATSELLSERDEEPSDDNPLRYRERIFVVAEGTSREQADAVVRDRFAALQEELAEAPAGKFFNLAVFDHRWTDRPERPPLVTLQWKDWRGDPVIEHPEPRPSDRPRPSRPPRSTTGEHDARLAHAFEACQDLLFLASPAEGVEFVVRLIGELVPSEAVTGCLYDINADEQRVVAALGPGADALRGRGLPAKAGLLEAALEELRQVLRVDAVAEDGRFDPAVEGRPGLTVKSALYVPLHTQGRLVGMLQLLNRVDRPAYTASDAEVAAYVAGQLADFVVSARTV